MADSPLLKAISVLVIDDDPLFRSLIVALLRKDCDVTVASEGSDGFYKALENPPDVALIDVQMPGWDGLKTLKTFRSHPALAQIRIVMLTSDSSRETILAAIREGANDYMIKTSFSKRDFFQKLNCLIPDQDVVSTAQESAPSEDQTPPQGDTQSEFVGSTGLERHPQALAAASTGGSNSSQISDSNVQELVDNWE